MWLLLIPLSDCDVGAIAVTDDVGEFVDVVDDDEDDVAAVAAVVDGGDDDGVVVVAVGDVNVVDEDLRAYRRLQFQD